MVVVAAMEVAREKEKVDMVVEAAAMVVAGGAKAGDRVGTIALSLMVVVRRSKTWAMNCNHESGGFEKEKSAERKRP
jgi:hypothetical protein